MPEPFAQPERRNLLIPIMLSLAVLAIAAIVTVHFFPATQVEATHVQTVLHSEDTVFKSNSIVLGSDHTEHVLYIASTIRVDNHLRVPITLEAFTLTFTNPDEAQLTAQSPKKSELANLEITYPALKPLLATPLLPETTLAPSQSAQGTLLFPLPIPESMWNRRKSAVIRITPYHQPPTTLTIPRTNTR